jgi:Uma2 family endonuclease
MSSLLTCQPQHWWSRSLPPSEPGTPNYNRDYINKRNEYAARGIPEYWIVDPSRAVVLVLLLQGTHYQEQRFSENQVILSPALLALNLTAEQVLQAGR